MSFVHTTIIVNNMQESLAFYQGVLDLNISSRFPTPEGEIVFLGDGETKVELIDYKQGNTENYGEGISLGFSVDSLDKAMEQVKEKGIKIESGPIQPNPKTRFFFIKDPNGLRIQLVEQAN